MVYICSTLILQMRSINKELPTTAMLLFMEKFTKETAEIKSNWLEHVFPHLLTTITNDFLLDKNE